MSIVTLAALHPLYKATIHASPHSHIGWKENRYENKYMYDDNGTDKIKNVTKQRNSRQSDSVKTPRSFKDIYRTVISSHMRTTTHCSRLSSESRDFRKQSVFKETDITDKLLRMNIYFAYFIHC